ncbi:MAG: hypothetical protein NTX82_07180 [Candidatus Parcubacteria bacterium]|nr:hypothetical protein [Candidatus Parcubacteria bacterium]
MFNKKLKEVRDSFFVRMMLPDSEEKALLYVEEEKRNLEVMIWHIKNLSKMNFVVIGAGALWYLDLVFGKVKKYIAIEPLADTFIQKQVRFVISKHDNIRVIGKELGSFKKNILPTGGSIFVFHFNILAYISNPMKNINKYIKKGDILYLSTWSNSKKAVKVRKEYFDFLGLHQFKNVFKIDPKENMGICKFDHFPFNRLKYYREHKRITGSITDILIIYC